ncbi:MAG: glycosyltransferase family 2 protein [Rhodocyclaceae bacterium]|nr:glycosyltransferase family 2 protein [Rhodocyclaceae bacterium]
MPLISIITPCFNEADNVDELHRRIAEQFAKIPDCDYEHIFIDNASTDDTVTQIRRIASTNSRVKAIVNSRNFGHIRSPMHALLQARGDAIITMASDLQDPPELIPSFVAKWREGFRVVVGVKPQSLETPLMSLVRRSYYRTIGKIADVTLIPNFTGFGLYDRSVVEIARLYDDPYPYFRGMISDIGFPHAEIAYEKPLRLRGITKNNFYTLYDLAMLGITSHSKVPIRLATMSGFALSALSLLVAVGYLIFKIMFWDQLSIGMAPILIGFFFFASVQLFFIGILGEYIANIHTQVQKRPLVVEKERINFESASERD